MAYVAHSKSSINNDINFPEFSHPTRRFYWKQQKFPRRAFRVTSAGAFTGICYTEMDASKWRAPSAVDNVANGIVRNDLNFENSEIFESPLLVQWMYLALFIYFFLFLL